MSIEALQKSIESIRNGPTEEGWAAFYRETRPKVAFVFFRRGVQDREQVKDLVQTTFLKFLTCSPWHYSLWRDLPDAPQVLAYLKAVAQHALSDHQRRQMRKPESPMLTYDLIDTGSGFEEEVGVLDSLSTALNEGERQLLELMLHGYDLQAIASHLGLSYSAVGTRVHRLRRRISKLL